MRAAEGRSVRAQIASFSVLTFVWASHGWNCGLTGGKTWTKRTPASTSRRAIRQRSP